jgi:hypothetical protein
MQLNKKCSVCLSVSVHVLTNNLDNCSAVNKDFIAQSLESLIEDFTGFRPGVILFGIVGIILARPMD